MASSTFGFWTMAITFAFFVLVQGTLGEIICENLEKERCAFAVSSSGKRCLLEKHVKRSGEAAYTCRTSEIEAEHMKDYIESDQCVKACGLDRKSLGISSDSLLEDRFTKHLCSPQCYGVCPNVVDLYFNLAAGEGVFLPKLCEAQGGKGRRREMVEMRSSGIVEVAEGPVEGVRLGDAPEIAPVAPPF